MSATLGDLADWLVHHRFATLQTVWSLTLPDLRRAARLSAQPDRPTPPSTDELVALMRAFPDTQECVDEPNTTG